MFGRFTYPTASTAPIASSRALLATPLLALAFAAAAHAGPMFQALPGYRIAHTPTSVALADLNADDNLDLAIAGSGGDPDYPGTVSILIGHGDGTFGTRTDFATGDLPRAIEVADLNRDGRPDLVTANHESNTVTVLLGNGDGTFGTRFDYGTLGSPQWVAIADVNGDERLDIATANGGGGTLTILVGNGDGTFRPGDGVTDCYVYAVALADLSGDGRPDLVAATDCSRIQMLLGNGDGTFARWQDAAAGFTVKSLAIADLDADGQLDLATSGEVTSVLLGDGGGSFQSRVIVDPRGETRLVIADMDVDGRLDLITNAGGISVLIGNGNGTFGAPDRLGGFGEAMAVGDVNRDGRPDLVAKSHPDSVSVLLNSGADDPTPVALALAEVETHPGEVRIIWYGQGAADLAAAVHRTTPDAEWSVAGTPEPDGSDRLVFTDRDVQPGARYGYRLVVREGGVERALEPVWVTVPHRVGLALMGASPNPAAAELAVAFSLPGEGAGALELFDLRGRLVARRGLAGLGAGAHRLPMTDGRQLASGVYLVRLTHRGRVLQAKACVVR